MKIAPIDRRTQRPRGFRRPARFHVPWLEIAGIAIVTAAYIVLGGSR